MPQHYWHPLFNAGSVAVFGASEREDSVAGILFRNLRGAGYKGEVYPVNPKHEPVFGARCYASAGELPAVPELALIATPAPTVSQIMEECGQRGIRHAIVLSAGFREVGAARAALEEGVKAIAKKYGIRFIGLNATFSQGATLAGDLALAFRIPIAQALIARDPMEAMLLAQQMGFPVAMKINFPGQSPTSQTSVACGWGCRAARRYGHMAIHLYLAHLVTRGSRAGRGALRHQSGRGIL